MKEKYYLIRVLEHSAETDSVVDHISKGYFTNIIKNRKYTVVGYDNKPEYEFVTRYKNKTACNNKIKQLYSNSDVYGGEGFAVRYDFELVEMYLEPLEDKTKHRITKQEREQAKDILEKILYKGIGETLEEYEKTLDNEEYEKLSNAICNVAATMIKSIGR